MQDRPRKRPVQAITHALRKVLASSGLWLSTTGKQTACLAGLTCREKRNVLFSEAVDLCVVNLLVWLGRPFSRLAEPYGRPCRSYFQHPPPPSAAQKNSTDAIRKRYPAADSPIGLRSYWNPEGPACPEQARESRRSESKIQHLNSTVSIQRHAQNRRFKSIFHSTHALGHPHLCL